MCFKIIFLTGLGVWQLRLHCTIGRLGDWLKRRFWAAIFVVNPCCMGLLMRSFYSHRSQNRNIPSSCQCYFALLGSSSEKPAHKMLMNLTPGVNFINILCAAFTLIWPKSAKRHCWLLWTFYNYHNFFNLKIVCDKGLTLIFFPAFAHDKPLYDVWIPVLRHSEGSDGQFSDISNGDESNPDQFLFHIRVI